MKNKDLGFRLKNKYIVMYRYKKSHWFFFDGNIWSSICSSKKEAMNFIKDQKKLHIEGEEYLIIEFVPKMVVPSW